MTDAPHQAAGPTPTLPEWLGLRLLAQDDHRVTVELTSPAEALNYRGEVHGGTLATLADVSMALAASAGLADDTVPVTAGLVVNYLRPATGRLVAAAEVVAGSERRRITQVVVTDDDDNQIAVATGTFAIVRAGTPPPPPLPPARPS